MRLHIFRALLSSHMLAITSFRHVGRYFGFVLVVVASIPTSYACKLEFSLSHWHDDKATLTVPITLRPSDLIRQHTGVPRQLVQMNVGFHPKATLSFVPKGKCFNAQITEQGWQKPMRWPYLGLPVSFYFHHQITGLHGCKTWVFRKEDDGWCRLWCDVLKGEKPGPFFFFSGNTEMYRNPLSFLWCR